MPAPGLTILICARNAAATIGRAVSSARAQGDFPIVVVDDWSADDTASRAREAGGPRLRVTRPIEHRALGLARQTALEAADTEWIMWIDADDEALAGRVSALLDEARRSGADIVFDDAELFDGATGAKLKDLAVPDFLRRDPTASRQFERNFVPSLGWGLMRHSVALRVGYDPEAHGVEDFDFCLRAIRAGARFAFRRGTGYRQYSYPTSVSRDLYRRRADLVRLYGKHRYEDIRQAVLAGGWMPRVATWVLVAAAVFREDYARALEFVDSLDAEPVAPGLVLEPEGPYPLPEGWRVEFQRGTLLALMGRWSVAAEALVSARARRDSADVRNNLGVVFRQLGLEAEAGAEFDAAGRLFPGYVDAQRNLTDPASVRLTPLPLRVQPNRNIY